MIVIVFGLPGVGKTYFAKALAKSLCWDYYGTDETRRSMSNEVSYSKEEKLKVYDELLTKISTDSEIIFDGTFSQKEVRDAFFIRGHEQNQTIKFIEISCDELVIKKRLQSKRPDSDADYSIYQLLKKKFQPLEGPYLSLRSDILSLEEMVHKAEQYIFN